jgi:tetratricopeptide (TPR) repeat protein
MDCRSQLMVRNLDRILAILLLVATFGTYWQVQNNDFIYFDDPSYVTQNRPVKAGLTKDSLAWAFCTFHASNWHPLTWLSHMLDCQLYGLNPAGHHLTSLFFHLANTLLLFLVLRESTGRRWPSFLVAGLFALHPLHVESVAWVSERKDVLSTFFWMLTILTYIRYVQRPTFHLYLLTLFLFVCGLLAKPMLVTLPFVLLLFDYWPLGRIRSGVRYPIKLAQGNLYGAPMPTSHLVWEKIPFFVLAAASSIVTFLAQAEGRAIQSLDAIPLQARIFNAVFSYLRYMAKALWPNDLAVFYPHPGNTLGSWVALGSALILIFFTILVLRQALSRPYLTVGWFWFLGTLVPVIGLIQVGMQAMADRYTYIPLVGLFVVAAWGLADLLEKIRFHRSLSVLFTAVILCAFILVTWQQVKYWQDTLSLFHRALKVTKDNYAAHFVIARVEGERGTMDRAFFHYNKAVEIHPAFVAMMHNRVGYHLAEQGQLEAAVAQFTKALEIRSDYASAHNNLGVVLARKGQLDEAIVQFSEALKISPRYGKAQDNMENVRRQKALLP